MTRSARTLSSPLHPRFERMVAAALAAAESVPIPLAGVALVVSVFVAPLGAQSPLTADGKVRVLVVKQPYHGDRNVPELSHNPDYIHASGLERHIESWEGVLDGPVRDIRLTPEEDEQYGEWNRLGMANAHLGRHVAEGADEGLLTIALEGNCNGDFNTPETTLSGMLGGMPVAVAAGHGLKRIRRGSGLERPLPMDPIVWGAVRDLDPLDPAEVPGHDLAVENGPSSMALAVALTEVFRYEKAWPWGSLPPPPGTRTPPRSPARRR